MRNSNNNAQNIESIEQYICYEEDRQITDVLNRRQEIQNKITQIKRDISKNSFLWRKNNEKCIRDVEIYEKELKYLETKLNATVYSFRETETQELISLKQAFYNLGNADAKTYDKTTPSNASLVKKYVPKGDMNSIHFSSKPLCIHLRTSIYCFIPCYIIEFDNDGDYVCTYSCRALKGGLANGSYEQKVKHTTWAHTRADGRPDRRYKNNYQYSYYTTSTHTVWDMLALNIVNYQLKYEVTESVKTTMIAAIKSYSSMQPTKTYDPVFHLVRLLKDCEPNNQELAKLEKVIDQEITSIPDFRNEDSSKDISRNITEEINTETSDRTVGIYKWNIRDVCRVLINLIIGGISAVFAVLMFIGIIIYSKSNNTSHTLISLGLCGLSSIISASTLSKVDMLLKLHSKNPPAQRKHVVSKGSITVLVIAFIIVLFIGVMDNGKNETTEPRSDIQETSNSTPIISADYTDIAEFEKAVNEGVDLIGKTVSFIVVDVRPDSILGHNLYGGDHLNFVSDNDPGVEKGDMITVRVTGVTDLFDSSYKITYVLLDKD